MERQVKQIVDGLQKVDGAGVHLTRVIGPKNVYDFDPFLMLDSFDSAEPASYIKGFPWHPHRGIETVTFLRHGKIEHGDSMGNAGVINDGDCQWMTGGSGIIHQEMPQSSPLMLGVQLWVNLPAKKKMTAPKYRDFQKADIPEIKDSAANVLVVAGTYKGVRGPMNDLAVKCSFLDITLKAREQFIFENTPEETVFVFFQRGHGFVHSQEASPVREKQAVLFDKGSKLTVTAGEQNCHLLLFAGQPLGEPIAWGGPIVMNTQDELDAAFRDLDEGNFIKHKNA